MAVDIVEQLRSLTYMDDAAAACQQAADEIVRLRAEVERKADYAERMDALAEERLIGWNAERALVNHLAEALHESTPATDCWCPDMVTGRPCLACRSRAALAAYEAARKEEQ